MRRLVLADVFRVVREYSEPLGTARWLPKKIAFEGVGFQKKKKTTTDAPTRRPRAERGSVHPRKKKTAGRRAD